MKKTTITFLLISAVIFTCTKVIDNTDVNPSPNPIEFSNVCVCPDTSDCQQLCSTLPNFITGSFGFDYQGVLDSSSQVPFDLFSWQSFIALNWPAGTEGNPLSGIIGSAPDSFRVWEQYPDIANVFDNTLFGASCAPAENQKKLFLYMKTPRLVNPDGSFEEADGHALLDRNLNFVLYDIRLNNEEVNYILNNNLNTKIGQLRFNGSAVDFPIASATVKGSEGAIEIKAAWRILDTTKGDDPSRYYSRKATIFIPGKSVKNGQALCIEETVGLVGLHISRKVSTPSANQVNPWIWSTFEHVDNLPDNPNAAQVNDQRYSFYRPDCINCPINFPPAFTDSTRTCYGVDNPVPLNPKLRAVKWARQKPYGIDYGICVDGENEGTYFGTQVNRLFPIFQYTQLLNAYFQDKLSGTVWANYKLAGTQWRRDPFENFTSTTDIPLLLGSAVQETFMQSTASCTSCHGFAKIEAKNGKISADHSFVLGRAQ